MTETTEAGSKTETAGTSENSNTETSQATNTNTNTENALPAEVKSLDTVEEGVRKYYEPAKTKLNEDVFRLRGLQPRGVSKTIQQEVDGLKDAFARFIEHANKQSNENTNTETTKTETSQKTDTTQNSQNTENSQIAALSQKIENMEKERSQAIKNQKRDSATALLKEKGINGSAAFMIVNGAMNSDGAFVDSNGNVLTNDAGNAFSGEDFATYMANSMGIKPTSNAKGGNASESTNVAGAKESIDINNIPEEDFNAKMHKIFTGQATFAKTA